MRDICRERQENDINKFALGSLLLTLNMFRPFFGVYMVEFKQVNVTDILTQYIDG